MSVNNWRIYAKNQGFLSITEGYKFIDKGFVFKIKGSTSIIEGFNVTVSIIEKSMSFQSVQIRMNGHQCQNLISLD